jgi:hypothetical protein
MIRNVKPAITLLAAAFLGTVLSSSALAASGSNGGQIYTLMWYEGHDGLLVRQTGMTDLGGCGRADYFILDRTHIHFKETYALLLAAHLTDQSVLIDVDGCSQGISRIRHVTSVR